MLKIFLVALVCIAGIVILIFLRKAYNWALRNTGSWDIAMNELFDELEELLPYAHSFKVIDDGKVIGHEGFLKILKRFHNQDVNRLDIAIISIDGQDSAWLNQIKTLVSNLYVLSINYTEDCSFFASINNGEAVIYKDSSGRKRFVRIIEPLKLWKTFDDLFADLKAKARAI